MCSNSSTSHFAGKESLLDAVRVGIPFEQLLHGLGDTLAFGFVPRGGVAQ
ncbi:hypothetical protein [Sorangium sp. So ce1099]